MTPRHPAFIAFALALLPAAGRALYRATVNANSSAPPRPAIAVRLACLWVLAIGPAAFPAESGQKTFDVPIGTAPDTLKQFSAQADAHLLYSAETVKGVTTNPVLGAFTTRDALERMLAGTRLAVTQDNSTGALAIVGGDVPNGARAATATNRGNPSDNPPVGIARNNGQARGAEEVTAAETVLLNPFVVESPVDRGYVATQTLVGTRLRSEVKDVATSLSILTEQFLDDINAEGFKDALAFVPNTAEFRGQDNTDDTGNSVRLDSSVSVRGIQSTFKSRNFFATNIPLDRFNTDSFTFARGPNGLLFGIGNPGGGTFVSTNQAQFRNTGNVRLAVGSFDKRRASVGVNRELVTDRLALRVDALASHAGSFREPAYADRESVYLNSVWQPLGRGGPTRLRFEAEGGRIDQSVARPSTAYDLYSTWADAGGPLSTGRTDTPPGTRNIETFVTYVNVVNDDVPGFHLPIMAWTGFKAGGFPNFGSTATNVGYYPAFGRDYTFLNPLDVLRRHFGSEAGLQTWLNGLGPAAVIPRQWEGRPLVLPASASITGRGDFANFDYYLASLFLEQRIGRSFHVELASSIEHRNTKNLQSLRPTDVGIKVDPNLYLPNGQPNPYAGFPYIESSQFSIFSLGKDDVAQSRATALYELNLNHRKIRDFGLGRHQIFGTWNVSRALNDGGQQQAYYSGGPGLNTTNVTLAANRLHPRYYLAPGQSLVLPDKPLAPLAQDGYSARWVNTAGTYVINRLTSMSLALQSFFLKDRLVLTYGIRDDDASVEGSNFTRYPNQEVDFSGRSAVPEIVTKNKSTTLSGVFHLTDWLSVWATNTDNFTPRSSNNVDIYNRLISPSRGEGLDYGVRFSALGGKLAGSLTRFRTLIANQQVSEPGQYTTMDSIWTVVDPSQRFVSLYTGTNQWLGSMTTASEGYELEMVANPGRGLRLRATAGYLLTKVKDRNAEVVAYTKVNRPAWIAYANNPANPAAFRTQVQNLINIWDTELASDLAEVGGRQLRQSKWTSSLAAAYEFSNRSALRGCTVGANHRWADRPLIGYGQNPDGTAIRSVTDHGPQTSTFGAFLSYRRKLWRAKLAWTAQLNVANLFNESDPVALKSLPDPLAPASGRFIRIRYYVPEPRTVSLTSSFQF